MRLAISVLLAASIEVSRVPLPFSLFGSTSAMGAAPFGGGLQRHRPVTLFFPV